MNAKNKKRMNNRLYDLTYNTYFPEIPLDDIFIIIREEGTFPMQEDGEEWNGLLLGRQGHTLIPLHGCKYALNLSWYKMPSGNYEVTVYIN